MRMPKEKEYPSWGHLIDYQGAVEEVSEIAKSMVEETDYYMNECGGVISDGEIYADHIREMIDKIEDQLEYIEKMARRFSDL